MVDGTGHSFEFTAELRAKLIGNYLDTFLLLQFFDKFYDGGDRPVFQRVEAYVCDDFH
jgi:hypothetical protein